MILKEKSTWIMGTALFIGYMIGGFLEGDIKLDTNPSLPVSILLVLILYFTTVLLVAVIKWEDRL